MTTPLLDKLAYAGSVRCSCGSTDVDIVDEPQNRKRFATCNGCGGRVAYTYGHDVPRDERRSVLRHTDPPGCEVHQ